MTSIDFKDMWKRVLGEPIPTDEQFELWAIQHSSEAIRYGIVKTAIKNQTMGGRMSQDHKERFASKVMLTKTADIQRFRKGGVA